MILNFYAAFWKMIFKIIFFEDDSFVFGGAVNMGYVFSSQETVSFKEWMTAKMDAKSVDVSSDFPFVGALFRFQAFCRVYPPVN